MAAGRQGGCYVNEFREAEMRTRVLKRERLRCFERECGRDLDRKRNQACEVRGEKSSYGRRGGDRIRRHGGEGKNGFVTGKRVREAGELPGERGSNDPDVLDSEIGIRDDSLGEAAAKTVVQEMKRKFSPFVWNKEDKQVSKLLKKKTDASCNSIPISSFQHLSHPSSVSSPIEVVCTPSDQSVISNYVPSPLGKETVPGQLEEEDCLHSRNVPACRWNEVNDSSGSESELTDEEGEFKKSKKVHSKINHKTKKLQSLELRDLSGGASQGAQSQPSGSGGGHCSTSVRGNKYQEVVLDGHDLVEVVEEDNSSGVSIHSVDRDSDTQSSNGSSNQVGPSPRGINMLEGCRNVVEFEKLNRINEGTYGVVFRAKDRNTGEIVALKKLKMEKETEGFPLTSLREINILLSLHHPSIIHVKEVVVGSRLDDIFMVMDYMEHDLKGVMETMKQPFSQSEVKCLMIQLLEGVKYLHDNWVLHRDLKTSNILLNNSGELKICDFGLARQYGSPLKPYTQLVVTLWYRAPELLLGAKKYSTAIDMWSLGCIMAEMLASEPLFTGRSEQDQIYKIYELLGMPNENGWPGCTKLPNYRAGSVKQPYNKLRERFPPTSFSGRPTLSVAGFDLLNKFLTYDPEKRMTAEEALNHEWFREVPLPKSKEFMPTFPAQHAKKGNYGKL